MNSERLFNDSAGSGRTAVFDASSVIEVKRLLRRDQWRVLRELENRVEAGRILVPREAAREVKDCAHPDAPGVWMYGVESKIQNPRDPDDEILREVLAQCPEMIDDPDQPPDGDPYVVALALQLRRDGRQAYVVTEDFNDKPGGVSVATACQRLGIPHGRLREYLQQEGIA